MSENKDYIQLPPLKKDTPSDVVAFMWEYMKVPEDSREKVKNLLKDANENGVKLSHQAPTLYDVVPKEEIAEFEELMRKTIADIVSEASSVACWVYVQKYVKHKTLNEMLQELPDVSQFILAMDALCLAAKRGVDVRIITPGIPDKKFIYNIIRSFYHGLVKHGVRVYECLSFATSIPTYIIKISFE